MQAQKDVVVSIHYTLTSDNGEVIDSSAGKEPLDYLHGHANIVPGLEEALEGASVGTELKVSIPPEKGYGVFDPEWVQKVPRSSFEGVESPGRDGVRCPVRRRTSPTLHHRGRPRGRGQGNHPLAGETPNFEVKVDALREVPGLSVLRDMQTLPKPKSKPVTHAQTDCCD